MFLHLLIKYGFIYSSRLGTPSLLEQLIVFYQNSLGGWSLPPRLVWELQYPGNYVLPLTTVGVIAVARRWTRYAAQTGEMELIMDADLKYVFYPDCPSARRQRVSAVVALTTLVWFGPVIWKSGLLSPLIFLAGRISVATPAYLNYVDPATLTLLFDNISTPFFATTLFIGIWAYFFSSFYMAAEVYKRRFVRLLICFLFSMLLLLSAGNLVTLFLGWELIGLFSFLLINFWVLKVTSLKSALKALTYNQLSDAALFLFIVLAAQKGNALSVGESVYTSQLTAVQTFALVVCVCCKSAQAPFHFWLPDSMEAPIPASALIHSATLVSAGVFLVLRLETYHLYNSLLVNCLLVVSLCTVVLGGISAAYQTDLKKILAYSTISNCGFIMLFAVTNKKGLCFLYFLVHGIFKALAFLVVGLLVILMDHKQDWRYLRLSPGHRNGAGGLLVAMLMLLGAWPGTITAYIKHVNIFHTCGSGLAAGITLVLFLGSAFSLVYSIKTACIVTQFGGKKVPTQPQALARGVSAWSLIRHQLFWYVGTSTTLLIVLVTYLLPVAELSLGTELLQNPTGLTARFTLLLFSTLIFLSAFVYKYKTPAGLHRGLDWAPALVLVIVGARLAFVDQF